MSGAEWLLIAAMDRNRGIGFRGEIPWHVQADIRHFRETTMGHTVVMGRKTYESIGRPLKGRRNVVLSRTIGAAPPGVELLRELPPPESLELGPKVFAIGGSEIYTLCMPRVTRALVTAVDSDGPADTWLPMLSASEWNIVSVMALEPSLHDTHTAALTELRMNR